MRTLEDHELDMVQGGNARAVIHAAGIGAIAGVTFGTLDYYATSAAAGEETSLGGALLAAGSGAAVGAASGAGMALIAVSVAGGGAAPFLAGSVVTTASYLPTISNNIAVSAQDRYTPVVTISGP
jgi:hypothetical protein